MAFPISLYYDDFHVESYGSYRYKTENIFLFWVECILCAWKKEAQNITYLSIVTILKCRSNIYICYCFSFQDLPFAEWIPTQKCRVQQQLFRVDHNHQISKIDELFKLRGDYDRCRLYGTCEKVVCDVSTYRCEAVVANQQ